MIKLGILSSRRGTHLAAILDAISQKDLSASVEIILSNRADALILERAKAQHIPAQYLDPTGLTREVYDQQVASVLKQYAVDVIVLMGYMRILSRDFVDRWQGKIINVHPSLLPAHAGKMDLDVHRAVLLAQERESGCSVHQVTAEVDAGPIILQKRCVVLPDDTPETLKARVQALEGEALVEALGRFN